MFSHLPTELKLNILSQSDSITPLNKEFHSLSRYINQKKVSSIIENGTFTLSMFCCNAKQSNKKFIYNLDPIINQATNSIEFQIKDLLETQEVIPQLNVTSKSAQTTSSTAASSHLDLLINQEQSSIKIYFQLQYKNELLKESSVVLNQSELHDTIKSIKDDLRFEIECSKGDIDDRNGYEFEDTFNYSLNLHSLSIKFISFIESFENKNGRSIIRY